jgi:hypothetical protein
MLREQPSHDVSVDTVRDRYTGLIWQRHVDPACEDGCCTWSEAQDYCAGLDLGDQSDWRLPTLKELQTLVDEAQASPAIDSNAFPGIPMPGAEQRSLA